MAATALREKETTEDRSRAAVHGHRAHRSANASARVAPRPARVATPRVAPDVSRGEENEDEHRVAARRKVRRAHKRGVPIVAAVASAIILAQLLVLMYVKGLALTATKNDAALKARIAATTEDIKQSQRRISSATSKPQVESWARRLKLRLVQQNDIDRVSAQTRPSDADRVLNEQAAPIEHAAPNEQAEEATR